MFSQLMETAEPWFSTFEHDNQKVNHMVQTFFVYLKEQIISVTTYNQRIKALIITIKKKI